MTDYPLTGGCNCGAVRFEVTAPKMKALISLVENANSEPVPSLPEPGVSRWNAYWEDEF